MASAAAVQLEPCSMFHLTGATGFVLAWAKACGDCGTAHLIFINRGGRTRCLECDQNYLAAVARGETKGPGQI